MKLRYLLLILAILSISWYANNYSQSHQLNSIDSYESCVSAKGSIIQGSYPATCVANDGSRFVEPTNNSAIDTTEWRSYINNEYGFSFQYPQNWQFNEEYLSDSTSHIIQNKHPLSVYVENDKHVSQLLISPELPMGWGLVTQEGAATVGEVQVKYRKYELTTHYSDFNITNLPNFSIDTYYSNPIIDQILQSFRFTDN